MKSEVELARLTKSTYSAAFKKCVKSDNLAWEAGCLSRTEENIPTPDGKDRVYDVIKVPLYNENQSRKGLVVFGRDITQRIKAQQQTAFLNQSALDFLQMEDTENIFEFIAKKVHGLIGEGIVLSASFDESTQIATLRSFVGIGPLLDKALKIINRNPVGMTAYLDEKRKKDVLEQSLTLRENLYEMLNGALNAKVCGALEQLLNIGEIYEMGFASKDWLLGDVTILLPKGKELLNRETIEAFSKLSAVALYRKQVKLRLIESEESYRGLFNSMTNAVYIMDREARFLDVNDGAVKMYGYPRERFIGKTPAFLSAPGKNEDINVVETLRKTFEGEPQQIEYWGVKKDGSIFPKDIKFYKGDYFGKTVVLAVADDITERFNMISQIISARDEAERNLQKITSIVMAFPDLILVLDREGNLLEAMSGNEDFASYFAASENRKHLTQFVPPHILKMGFENIRKVLSTGSMQVFNIDLTDEGLESHYEIRMVKYNEDQVLTVARDITRSIELINELNLEKNKAEESDRLKTAFLHNISHEIRTPLNGIVGFSNLLTQPGVAQGDTSEYVSFINSCSDQLLAIINDIVSIATLEAGQEKLQESTVDLNKMMNRVLSQFSTKANEKGLEIDFTTGLPDDNCLIVADETKLIQLLSNLIGNSVKFTGKGGVKFGYVIKHEFVEFYVQDSGIGIPENMHEVIFDRFRQVNNTLSLNTGGTGLGLSISKSYVELMGGRIWLKSIPGERTVFFFIIPYKSVSGGYSAPKISPAIHDKEFLRDRVILVAEDEEINFRLIKGMLASTGVKFIHVYNGADAVEKCKTNEVIDLVLMDLKMNVMDGFTAAGFIRNIRPELPIIAQSALALVGDRHRAIEAGCTDYISKPLRKASLIALLEKYLKR
jgi:PAS domain S-box-containing protein